MKYEDFVHGYRLDEEDQCRGVPWLASCLDTMGHIRDWDKAMLDAAEMLAKTGVLWQLKNPEGTVTPVQGTVPMARGQMVFGPPGYEATQLSPTQPSGDQQSWRSGEEGRAGPGREHAGDDHQSRFQQT